MHGSRKKANMVLGMISRCIEYKSKEVVNRLYKSLVRPHLEYCVQAWSPYFRKDIDLLERVQRRATKLVSEYRTMPYAQRLKKLGWTTLEKRRTRGDLIETFKILHDLENLDKHKFFTRSISTSTRGHTMKLFKEQNRLDTRKHFFSQRIVNDWNKLPQYVIDARTVLQFKIALEKYFNE